MGESVIRTNAPFERAGVLGADIVRDAIRARGFARVAMSGGSAAEAVRHLREALDHAEWGKVRLTWVDERCVVFDSPQSNRGEAMRQGVLSEHAPPGFELPLWLDGETPERAIARVTNGLEREFGNRLDLAVLGMGEDGHIASIFPGRPASWEKGKVAFVRDSPKPPEERITLLFDVLRTAGRALVVFAGESKRPVFERVLSGDPLMPVNVLPEVTFITDLAEAS